MIEGKTKAEKGELMEGKARNREGSPFQPVSELQEEIGSSAGVCEILRDRLETDFDVMTFYQFVEMTIIMRRMDEVDGMILFGDEEEKQRRFAMIADLYADPNQEETQGWLMETYGYQSTLYVLIIIVRLLKQEDRLADAIERFKAKTPATSDIWADYQWFLHLHHQGRDREANELLVEIQKQFRWNDRFDIQAVDSGIMRSEDYVRRALIGPSRLASERSLKVLADGALTMEGRSFDFSLLMKDPIVFDNRGMLAAKEAFLEKFPETASWIRLFDAWHCGDYESFMEGLGQMAKPEGAAGERYAGWISIWRYYWLLGEDQRMLESIEQEEDGFGDEICTISMRAMKAMSKAKLFGQHEGFRSIRSVWYESLVHHGSRFGEKDFDSVVLIETAIMTKDEEIFLEILHRTEKYAWSYWWVLGRIQEYRGEWEAARESFLALLESVQRKNECFLFAVKAREELALLSYELGEIEAGKAYEDGFLSLMKRINELVAEFKLEDLEGETAWKANLDRRKQVLEAKRFLAEGRMQESIQLMQMALASYRLQGQTNRYEYGTLEKDTINLLLQTGRLAEAKEGIEGLPESRLLERMTKAGYLIQWARMMGEDEILRENRTWLVNEMKKDQDLPKTWIENLKRMAMITELQKDQFTEAEILQLERRLERPRKSIQDLQGIITEMVQLEAQGFEVPPNWDVQVQADMVRLGNPPYLEIAWLKRLADQAEDPQKCLKRRWDLLRQNYGPGQLETLYAWMDWIETEPAGWMDECKELIGAAKFALVERVSGLPMERQMNFAKGILRLYDRVCLFGLKSQKEELAETLASWTYQIKGFSMRIQYFALCKMRQRNRRSDYLRFADLSLRIAESPVESEEDRAKLQKMKVERETLMKNLSIYQDFAVSIGAGAFLPSLPPGKHYIELLVTEEEVFSFERNDRGWSYRHLGTAVDWERKILRFRRNLMRGKADFKAMAFEIFGQVQTDEEISWAPDGMFFTLPFSELFAEAGLQDYEIWPNHLYARTGARKFHASSGTMLVAGDVAEKPRLEFAYNEAFQMMKMGLRAILVDRSKEAYLRDYRGFFHFSGHGEVVVPEDRRRLNPFVSSRLVLPNHQAMTALDFSILNWSACPLVFLNACESGSGAYVSSQGVLGLSYGLFLGGAETLILTQYPVEDRIAVRFSMLFYDALFQTQSRHYSFLLAKQVLSDDGVSEKDLAAFQMIGSGDELKETWVSRMVRWKRRRKLRGEMR